MSIAKLAPDGSAVRFAIVSVLGLLGDFIFTPGLSALTPLPLAASSGIYFATSSVIVYFVHEHWTFRRAGSATSSRRLSQTIGVALLALLGRVVVIGGLELLHDPALALSVVYAGAGAVASFSIGYLGNRYWVFATPAG